MVSAVDQGQHRSALFSSQPLSKAAGSQFHSQNGNPFDRLTGFKAPTPSAGPIFGGSSWTSTDSIWRTSASHFGEQDDRQPIGVLDVYSEKLEGLEATYRSASTIAPFKKAISRSIHTYNNKLTQDDTFSKTNDNTQYAPATHNIQSSLTSHTPTLLASPTRLRAQALTNPGGALPMSTLSNAALLSGSAPDDEASSSKAQSTNSSQIENKLKNLNVSRVNEFVPSWQATQVRSSGFGQSHGRTPFADCSRPGCTQSHTVSSNHRAYLNVEHHQEQADFNGRAREAQQTSFLGSDFDHMSGRAAHQGQPFADPVGGNFVTRRSRLDSWPLFDDSDAFRPGFVNSEWSGRFNEQPNSLQSAQASSLYPTASHPDTNGSFSQPADMHHFTTSNGIAYLENKNGVSAPSHAIKNGLYTPAFTPPTASESHRSTSDSGPSTRASSQTIDSNVHNPDRYLPANTTFMPRESHAFNDCYPSYPYYHGFSNMYQGNSIGNVNNSDMYSSAECREDPNKPVSPFLREFKVNCRTKHYTLKDVYNYVVEFSGDQHGSRFIQDKLSSANSDEKERVFAEVRENALQLMTDIFGNYVVQKMFEHGTQAQKKSLASQMKGRVLYLTTQVYGCRVVQKALEHVLVEQQASMVQELHGHVLPIVENQNGNHVIQKAIELVPGEHIGFIADALRGQVVRLAKHNYGCRVVQRMLEYSDAPIRRAIFDELYPDIPSLITDTFGNYVVQNIIRSQKPKEIEDEEDQRTKTRVVELVRQQLLYYSKHKFASNVVEVAIDFASKKQQQEILNELTGCKGYGLSPVLNLLRDQYGNYVIQKVLSKVQGGQLWDLVNEIRHHLVTLRRVHNGRQVAAMEKALMDATAVREADDAPPGLYVGNPYPHMLGPGRMARVPFSPRGTFGPSRYLPVHNFQAHAHGMQ